VVISGKFWWALMMPPTTVATADEIHPEIHRLDVLPVYLALLGNILLDLQTVLAGAPQPDGYRPLSQITGVGERLDWTIMTKEPEDGRLKTGGCPQPVNRGVPFVMAKG
jgi:hypothetical protein